MAKPKFQVGQVIASSSQTGEYMRIIAIGREMLRVLGYSGEYAVSKGHVRPLTNREKGDSNG